MGEPSWRSALTEVAPNRVSVRGYPLEALIGRVTFAAAVYLLLRGELPSEPAAALIDAILVSSVDHGASPPSTLAARTVASTGASLSASVAAGVLAVNRHHGGAIEGCMELLLRGRARLAGSGGSAAVASALVRESREAGIRLPGFGHRLHTDDPRSLRLLELAQRLGVAGDGVALGRDLAAELARSTGRPMPLNVDGAIAALLVDLGFEPRTGNAFFLIARMPGLLAHVLEEQAREKPMRVIFPTGHGYDGPSSRSLNGSASGA
jgi:citrate synthase